MLRLGAEGHEDIGLLVFAQPVMLHEVVYHRLDVFDLYLRGIPQDLDDLPESAKEFPDRVPDGKIDRLNSEGARGY